MCPMCPNSLLLMKSVKGNLSEMNSVWTTTDHIGCWEIKGEKNDKWGRGLRGGVGRLGEKQIFYFWKLDVNILLF